MGIQDYILLLSLITTTLGILISSLLIRKQMRITYNLHLRDKALSYSLFSNPSLIEARLKIESEFGPLFEIRESIAMKTIKETAANNSEIISAIMTVLAHWENMALAIKAGTADKEVCRDMVASTLIQHLRVFYNFLEKRREQNPRIYINLVKLGRDWQDELGQTPSVDYNPVLR
jgi:hypothetical protein